MRLTTACVSGLAVRAGWSSYRPQLECAGVRCPARRAVLISWATSWAGAKNGSHPGYIPPMPAPPARSRSGRPRPRTEADHRRPPVRAAAGRRRVRGVGLDLAAAVKRVDLDIARSQRSGPRPGGSRMGHRQTLGCGSPGAYRAHSALPAARHRHGEDRRSFIHSLPGHAGKQLYGTLRIIFMQEAQYIL